MFGKTSVDGSSSDFGLESPGSKSQLYYFLDVRLGAIYLVTFHLSLLLYTMGIKKKLLYRVALN